MIRSTKCLIERKQLFQFLKENLIFNEAEEELFFEHIKRLVYNVDFDDSQTIKDHMLWVSNNNLLKLNDYKVPENILSNSVLYDIKVQSKGPDDAVFNNNSDIRARIARGNTVLERTINGQKQYELILFALRKFSGGLGDEDDIDCNKNNWSKYFLKDIDQTKYVISLQKANGEAAHMSCRFIDGQYFICAGSKNVHILFRSQEEICKYAEEKFTYARLIGEAICKHLHSMDEEKEKLLLAFLSWTKLTAIFEILIPNSQHVEDLSYLNEPLLKFITFTENKLYDKPQSLCCMPDRKSVV